MLGDFKLDWEPTIVQQFVALSGPCHIAGKAARYLTSARCRITRHEGRYVDLSWEKASSVGGQSTKIVEPLAVYVRRELPCFLSIVEPIVEYPD